jgi:Mg2+/citrate symporter
MKIEVIEKLAALVTAAFGLVAALAWNGAIKAIFVQLFGSAETIGPMLTYAIVVTIIAVLTTIYIGKIEDRTKRKFGVAEEQQEHKE